MSVSLCVSGIVPADETFKKMKHIYDSCEEMGIDPPPEVIDFFDDEVPDDAGMVVYLDRHMDGVTELGYTAYEIEIDKLDPKIKIIRCSLC